MFARNLEQILQIMMSDSDFQGNVPYEMEERFESLREYGRLPRGREKRAQHLTSPELAAAILGLVPVNPKWAGHAAIVLEKLRPVGGEAASFRNAPTLGAAVELLVTDAVTAAGFVDLSLSAASFGTNNNGFAKLRYIEAGTPRSVHFVSEMAFTLMHLGAEKHFKLEDFCGDFCRSVTLSGQFFASLRQKIEQSLLVFEEPSGEGSEYNAEEARQARFVRLGARPNSCFLNMAIDTQVTWPKEETVISFDRYRLVLMPKTKEHTQSIHIDLAAHRLDHEKAITVVNRFLSLMAWCDDQFAIVQNGWSGNSVPVAVAKRDLAFSSASYWVFDRQIPPSEKMRRALGHYREARNAEFAGLVSYAVLSYYKVLEVDRKCSKKVISWIDRNYPAVAAIHAANPAFIEFATGLGATPAKTYLGQACRVAVAHASLEHPSDIDDAKEASRLHVVAEVMRELARRMIRDDLKISDSPWEQPESQIVC